MKYLGCAYYPEYWGEERVAIDAALMVEAGIEVVRIGEFAWSRMEASEGRFTLGWLHHAVRTLGEHGIKVLLCTPSATPPAWLTSAYPDTLVVRSDGTRAGHGQRRHYCTTSDTFRRHCSRITTRLAEEFAGYENVIGWQIDNELGPEMSYCYCENCQSRFRVWLHQRYDSLENLRASWRTGFWSMDFYAWDEVRLGVGDAYSSILLDTKRFHSEMMVDFGLAQAAILRRLNPGKTVTTNGMGPIFTPLDYTKLFGQLDVACDDLYFDIATMDASVAAMSVYRNLKPGHPFWLTETGSGALDHNKPPHPDQFRAWMWSAFANGSDAHFVFRWRTCLSGQEQELQGILETSGLPGKRYDSVRAAFREMQEARPKLGDLPLPTADVAIVYDYDVIWAYEASRVGKDVKYSERIHEAYRELYRRRMTADVISAQCDFARYKVVIVPNMVMVTKEVADALARYIDRGGVVVAIGQLGMRDGYDNYLAGRGPDHMQDTFGIHIDGGMYLTSHVGADEALWVPANRKSTVALPVAGRLNDIAVVGAAQVWAADLSLNGAKSMLTFENDAYAGQPALTENSLGLGRAIYLGTASPDEMLLRSVLDYAFETVGISGGVVEPEHVEVVRRGDAVFAINHRSEPASAVLPDGEEVHLAAFGVHVQRAGDVVVPGPRNQSVS